MNIEVRANHFEMNDESRAYLDKKLERLEFAKDSIQDLSFSFTKDREYKCEANIHFRWGEWAHVIEHDFDIDPGIDKLMDKMEIKIARDKERKKRHNFRASRSI